MRTRRNSVLPVAAAALLLAGCGIHKTTGPAPGDVAITLSGKRCGPADMQIAAGAYTFAVSNTDAAALSEYELLQGEQIVGEVENVTPGLSGSFTLRLAPGIYTARCPGAAHDERIVVTASPAHGLTANKSAAGAENDAIAARTVAHYRAYIAGESAQFADASHAFLAAVRRGDRSAAMRLYAAARMPYERIEPVAESFPDLDRAIDARENSAPASGWTGYHRIEKILWSGAPMHEALPYADRLEADIHALRGRIATIPLQPAQIANGAVALLNEVVKTKVTGEEERYSHTDLADFQANVQGSRAAFDAVQPLLRTTRPGLARTLDTRFVNVSRRLAKFEHAGSFVSYLKLTPSDVRSLAAAVDALAEPLSQVARHVVTAESQGSDTGSPTAS